MILKREVENIKPYKAKVQRMKTTFQTSRTFVPSSTMFDVFNRSKRNNRLLPYSTVHDSQLSMKSFYNLVWSTFNNHRHTGCFFGHRPECFWNDRKTM